MFFIRPAIINGKHSEATCSILLITILLFAALSLFIFIQAESSIFKHLLYCLKKLPPSRVFQTLDKIFVSATN